MNSKLVEVRDQQITDLKRELAKRKADTERLDAFSRFFTDTVLITDPITNKKFEGKDLREAIDNYMGQEKLN